MFYLMIMKLDHLKYYSQIMHFRHCINDNKCHLVYHFQLVSLSRVDKHGLYSNIAHNNFTRSSFLNLQLPDLLKFYEAYLTWTEEISKEENQVRHKLKPGEIWAFDNVRILHAREKYDTSISARYVEGIYLDWDEVYSTIRTLRRRLGIAKDDRNSFE